MERDKLHLLRSRLPIHDSGVFQGKYLEVYIVEITENRRFSCDPNCTCRSQFPCFYQSNFGNSLQIGELVSSTVILGIRNISKYLMCFDTRDWATLEDQPGIIHYARRFCDRLVDELPLPTWVYARDGTKTVRLDPTLDRLRRRDFEVIMLFFPQFPPGNPANRFVIRGDAYEEDHFLGKWILVDHETIDIKITRDDTGEGVPETLEKIRDEDDNLAILARKGLLNDKQQKLQREKFHEMQEIAHSNLRSTLGAMTGQDTQKTPLEQRLSSREGFCEDCGNYSLLHEEDCLYVCDQCQRLKSRLHRYEILGLRCIPIPL